MIATAKRPAMPVLSMPRCEPQGAAARALADAFLRYASACWRGEACAAHFATRLGAYWRAELPAAPAAIPDAFSPHGAGGRGIAWYETPDAVLGYVLGHGCGFQVPIGAVSGLTRCVATGAAERSHDRGEWLWAAAGRVARHGAAA